MPWSRRAAQVRRGAVPRVALAAAPYVVGRDERGRTIYSSRPDVPRRV